LKEETKIEAIRGWVQFESLERKNSEEKDTTSKNRWMFSDISHCYALSTMRKAKQLLCE
jgi:hypothetical protein